MTQYLKIDQIKWPYLSQLSTNQNYVITSLGEVDSASTVSSGETKHAE